MRRLLAQGHHVRAATRDPATFPLADFPDVEPVAADFADPASIARVAKGADAIVMNLPFTFDREVARGMGRSIREAADAADIERIVFHTSCVVVDHDLGVDGHDARRDIEAELARAKARHVFVRSAVFMDNMIRVWSKPSIVNHGIFAYPCKPDLGISWIDQEDISAYMVAALEAADPPATLLVGGPEVLTGDEVAARLSLAAGKPIRFRSLHPDEFAGAMSQLVTGDARFAEGSIYDRMAQFYRWYNAQPTSPLALDLRPVLAVLPVRPTPLLVWAQKQDWSHAA
jgi:uncharacterized protein YbjT (DUF2867 family)